ncbi:MAG: SpoIID/LytB domain-containing protein [Planctomycetes bacterium]|nr:SpoIID/LytB domain-containing protein [Planctomycetota bacterium]MCL4729152.1 SpoIID/LytB domain-containing protein [Planctomycetota bacterium]
MKKRPVLLAALTAMMLAVLIGACASGARQPDDSAVLMPIPVYGAAPIVRVKLAAPSKKDNLQVDAGRATLRLDGVETTLDGATELRLSEGLITTGSGTGRFAEITPLANPGHFSLDGRTYRGVLRLHAATDGWEVVNVVDLEQYVAGVIGWEMIASWPVEALKAQAIASRTYAVFTMEESRALGRNWDLDDTTRYQVYGGVGPTASPKLWRETANVLAARSQTTGMVLTYRGKGFKTFFHSTSGGHTTDVRTALGVDAVIEPLQGVELGNFDQDSPKHQWKVTLSAAEVNARMLEARLQPGQPIRIVAEQVASSGHAVTVRVHGPTGASAVVKATELRHALGLPSTNFTARRSGDEWLFEGKGYGHGAGMCQWSARGMARQGWDSTRILKTMYPGSELKTLY